MESKLKSIRNNLNITQVEAANILGVSRRTYQKYENENINEENIKYKYMIEKLNSILVDEDKKILSIERIKEGANKIFSKYDVEFCYLFGSYAKSKAKETSDIDLLVSTNLTGLKFFSMVEELREEYKKKVEVLNVNQLYNNKKLFTEILRDGFKIYG